MQQSLERLEGLARGCMKIVNHMHDGNGGASNPELARLKQAVDEVDKQLSGLRAGNGELDSQSIASLKEQIDQIERIAEPLNRQMENSYRQEVGSDTQAYQSLPIDEQREYEEAYHGKIDTMSMDKLKDNLSEMRSVLNGAS
ncbi:hypothetical protein PAE9249_04062 [Paenibacillus sp. CECT 9249]|uniref:DUF3450 domain-containing protein n=2 Tax=unclassified Paenibacillus TaxID=185978 RepID=UPI001E642239|nr:DUF3450 domain-containing protein [Paenibacillus sp. CECT 9249]CAH0121531.1 hypothetical protein PAE9249_04062 [Paenibacillus sp. CECT 9249]